MNNTTLSQKRIKLLICTGFLIGSLGCVSPFNTKTPQVVHRPAELERREAQVQDPYPDSKFGPDTGFRPLGFTEQRSEPLRAKDRYYSAMLRTQNGNRLGPQTMLPPSPHSGRPQVTNPHLSGPQQAMIPSAYAGNQYPQPAMATVQQVPGQQVMVPASYVGGQQGHVQQVHIEQAPNVVAPIPPPAYYPMTYR